MPEHSDPRLGLLAITDDLRDGSDGLVARALAAERGGTTMVLLRLKHADALTLAEVGRALVTALAIPVVVSERLDVALACGAAGVHLTSSSLPVIAIRPHVPADFLIGASVSSASDLEGAAGASYATIGPVFGGGPSSLEMTGFTRLARACGIPAIAIGGIDAETAPRLRSAGAAGVAAISAILGSPDPEAASRALRGEMAAP